MNHSVKYKFIQVKTNPTSKIKDLQFEVITDQKRFYWKKTEEKYCHQVIRQKIAQQKINLPFFSQLINYATYYTRRFKIEYSYNQHLQQKQTRRCQINQNVFSPSVDKYKIMKTLTRKVSERRGRKPGKARVPILDKIDSLQNFYQAAQSKNYFLPSSLKYFIMEKLNINIII